MKLETARKLMGQESQKYSDFEVEKILKTIKAYTDVCCDRIIEEMADGGIQNIKTKLSNLS